MMVTIDVIILIFYFQKFISQVDKLRMLQFQLTIQSQNLLTYLEKNL